MDKIKCFACLLLFLVSFNNASASIILDTGATPSGDTWALSSHQWLAGRFSLDDDVTLDGMEGLIGHTWGGRFEMELYEGTTSLYSNVVHMRPTWHAKWTGLSGLDIDLSADTEYTLVFRGLGLFYSRMAANATNPLDEEFYTDIDFNWHTWRLEREWHEFSDHYPGNLGIRLHGDVSAVPVPAAVWLFGSGLLGLVGLARKKA
jgi:hypothetical protein